MFGQKGGENGITAIKTKKIDQIQFLTEIMLQQLLKCMEYIQLHATNQLVDGSTKFLNIQNKVNYI